MTQNVKNLTVSQLRENLIEIANKNLPKYSGFNKILEVLICFKYGLYDKVNSIIPGGKEEDHFLKGEEDNTHIKVVFWHPLNSMLVSYNSETYIEDIPEFYYVTANASSTWSFDGLKFLSSEIRTTDPSSCEILSFETKEVKDTELDEANKTFFYV